MKSTCVVFGLLAAAILSGCNQRAGNSPPSEAGRSLVDGTKVNGMTPDELAADQAKRNEFVRKCMKQAGFTYIPFVPKFDTKNDGLPDSWEEEVAMWGFHVSTDIEGRFSGKRVPAKLLEEDPNMAIIQGFAAQEQAAYGQAFMDCHRSQIESLGPSAGTISNESQQRNEEIQIEIDKDERVVAAGKAWATCMSNGGIAATNRESLLSSLEKRAQPFIDKYSGAVDGELQKHREASGDDYPGSGLRIADVLTAEELVSLEKLQQYEMTAAAMDLQCYESTGKILLKVEEEIRSKL